MSIRELIGHRSTLMMYRDCLKVAPMMSPGNPKAIDNIQKHFRVEFEKQRNVTDEEEHKEFRSGIVRLLSNFMAYEVKTQYLSNPERFQKERNIYDDDEKDDEEAAPAGGYSRLPYL